VFAALQNQLDTLWVVLSGVGGYLLSSLLIGLVVRKRLSSLQNEMQEMMQVAQARISRSIQEAQNKPGANPGSLQKQIERKQSDLLKKALTHTERFEPYQKWAPTLGRQIATMRLQFLYQLGRMEEVDELLAIGHPLRKPMLMEPTLVAMKMARAYKRDDIDTVEKIFKKHSRWIRGDRGSLLYALMAWVWVKQGKTDEAQSLLMKAKEKTGNETLARNWEHLANQRVKKFSNAGLGEEWFALQLERPPKPKVQRARGRRQGGF